MFYVTQIIHLRLNNLMVAHENNFNNLRKFSFKKKVVKILCFTKTWKYDEPNHKKINVTKMILIFS